MNDEVSSGLFVNPGKRSYEMTYRTEYFRDKSGILEYLNRFINTEDRFICLSHPRRFGKTVTANMISAYYDRTANSASIFNELEIAKMPSYQKHLNQYNIIHIDFQNSTGSSISSALESIQSRIIEELRTAFPQVPLNTDSLAEAISELGAGCRTEFIVVIDEWDAFLREHDDTSEQKLYIDFLRRLFKDTTTNRYIALAYLTGIMPIVRNNTESALNNFREYTMLDSGFMAEYIGFTDKDVQELCSNNGLDYAEAIKWYDGYQLSGKHIFNPNSIASYILYKKARCYWTQTTAFETLKNAVSLNLDGLKDAILLMLGSNKYKVNTIRFSNNVRDVNSCDDALTMLIHLGYLAYDSDNGTAWIPNEEIRSVFYEAVRDTGWSEVMESVALSEKLLEATWNRDETVVAEIIEKVHAASSSIIKYNDEADLSCVITLAYYTANRYYSVIRELPAGKGFADLVFVPNKGENKPAMVVELKYDRSADTAIQQIKRKDYPSAVSKLADDILLVGISYDKSTKKHECSIELIKK